MAEALGTGVIELVADARKLKAGIEEAKKSIRTLGEGQKDISKSASASIDRYIGKLQQQNAAIGKSAREIELFKLAQRGASNEQINAANAALKFAENSERTAKSLRSVAQLAGIAAGAIVSGFLAAAAAMESLLGKAASFQDLSEKVGDSAENIAALAVAAEVGGSNIESVSQAMIKLQKNLTGVDDEAEAAGAALSALGINIAAFKQLSPTEQYREIAKALDQFADSGSKAAVVQALLGKEGAAQLPVLKELAQETEKQTILTNEQIKLADDYKDAQTRLRKQFELQAIAIAVDLLPVYEDLQKAFVDTIKQMLGVEEGASDLANSTAIQEFALSAARSIAVVIDGLQLLVRTFQIVGKTIAGYAAAMDAVQRLDFRGAIASAKALGEDISAIVNKPLFSTNLESRIAARTDTTGDDRIRHTPARDELRFSGATKTGKKGAGADTSRQDAAAQLALDLELIKEAGDAQINAFRNAESIMQALRSAQLVDDKTFYESKLAFIQTFAREEEAQLQAQIERRQKETFSGKEALQDQLKNQREIEKLQAQIVKIRADAVAKEQINSIEAQAALKKIQQGYEDARIAAEQYLATVAKANARDIAGAGRGNAFRQDQANRGAIEDRAQQQRERLQGELRRQQITREQFDTYLSFVEDTYNKEVAMYEDRSRRLDELQRDWLTGANEALNNYIDMTKDTARQFEDVFTKAFSSLEDFIGELTSGGIKSFKDLGNAFAKLATGIAADFAKIEIREKITGPLAELLKEKLPDIGGIFGKTAKAGAAGAGGLIDERHAAAIAKKAGGGIAGVGGEAANAAQFTTAVTTAGTTFATEATTAGTTIATEVTSAGTAFAGETTAAGASITAAAASFAATVTTAAATFASTVAGAGAVGGGSEVAGDFLSDLLLDSFATGTPYVPKTGPYLLHQGERVIPAGQNGSGGGMSIVINQSFPPGTNMETVNQASVKTGRAVRLAQQRGFSG